MVLREFSLDYTPCGRPIYRSGLSSTERLWNAPFKRLLLYPKMSSCFSPSLRSSGWLQGHGFFANESRWEATPLPPPPTTTNNIVSRMRVHCSKLSPYTWIFCDQGGFPSESIAVYWRGTTNTLSLETCFKNSKLKTLETLQILFYVGFNFRFFFNLKVKKGNAITLTGRDGL
jgi:hypothetical protein